MKTIRDICLLLGVLFLPSITSADSDSDKARMLLQQGEVMSLESLLPYIRQHCDGQILEIELEQHQNMIFYEVEILDKQGIVHKLKFDVKTGRMFMHDKDGEEQ